MGRRRIFQVAYDETLMRERSALLWREGYAVASAFGNEASQAILMTRPRFDLFIIGHNAPEQTRLQMVAWLHEHYPHTKILALNPVGYDRLDNLRFNATYDPPEAWLPTLDSMAT